MSTSKEEFFRMIEWYRANKPDLRRVSVNLTWSEMDTRFEKRDGKHFYYEFEVMKTP